ncbi:MAG: hypothetical protein Q7S68_03275 [Deltaproteobacteria bacterium]|nr:hypothetical protein [Deltaproteobacteria bacterium]
MLDSVRNQSLGSLLHAGWETGGQLGLSLGASILAGLPFNTKKWKLIATGLGGGVPALFKTSNRKELLFNTAELAAGIAVGFLPSVAMMFVASAGLSFGFEFFRNGSLSSSFAAAGFSSLIGGAFYGIPHLPTKHPFHAWGGDEKRWSQALMEARQNLPDIEIDILGEILRNSRRHAAEPNTQWLLSEEKKRIRKLQGAVATLEREKRKSPLLTDQVVAPFFDHVTKIYGRLQFLRYARQGYFNGAHSVTQNPDRHVLRSRAFEHEILNQLDAFTDVGIRSDNLNDFAELLTARITQLAGMKPLLAFYQEKPKWHRAAKLIQKQLSAEGAITFDHHVLPPLNRDQQFDAAVIVKELGTNALRVANARGVKDPLVRVLTTRHQIIVEDNALGIRPVEQRPATERGASGQGTKLIRELAQINGWRIEESSIEKGTRFTIHLG